jgi:ElaB/YqjD/DUF883 family membrane-anchored ribosome-binding protein
MSNHSENSLSGNESNRKIQDIGNQLKKYSYDVGEKVGSMASDLSRNTAKYSKLSHDYIYDNPGKSVIYATATGVVLGGLLTTFLRSRK